MSNSLYYGEIVAKISYHLYQNPDHKANISHLMSKESDTEDSIWTLCADAARVFDAIEDLSDEHFIDWHAALDHFADEILNHLLLEKVPHIIDLVSMACRSIENTM